MKFGAREICDVVLKATVNGQKIGDQIYKEGQPVMYFDSLKTSSMEQASTPVYAQGGKGNSRLVSWDGDKTITYVMEDALLSPISLAILAKAGLTTVAEGNTTILVHAQERVAVKEGAVTLDKTPVIGTNSPLWYQKSTDTEGDDFVQMDGVTTGTASGKDIASLITTDETPLTDGDVYFVDYYFAAPAKSTVITIEPESFEGNYYLEASTLFRDKSGKDLPAEFIIPNCKPQSAMTFAMASSGDPSAFTFTMDAFPGYVKYDKTKKVLAAIQILEADDEDITGAGNGLTQF